MRLIFLVLRDSLENHSIGTGDTKKMATYLCNNMCVEYTSRDRVAFHFIYQMVRNICCRL